MAAAVIVVAVVALAAAVIAYTTRRRLAAQRELTRVAEERADARQAELAATAAALEAESTAREAESTARAAANALAEDRAEEARRGAERADAAELAARQAAERAAAAEASLATLRESPGTSAGVDAAVLWILEQARSERTWRFSVAPHPNSPSVLADAADPLLAAIQVELDAAREDVGAVVELEAEIPAGVTTGAAVLALRTTQELLADVVRRSEESTVRVRAEGRDLVVEIDAVDEDGAPVFPNPLPLPPSPSVEPTAKGVRIHAALGEPPVQ